MDIITLALAKKFATKVAAGFSNVEVDGMDINFTLNDGTKTTLTVPVPADGVSVVDLNVNNNKHLICTMSDGSTVDAGEVPFVTPQRGIDYWTEADKAAMKSYIDESMLDAFYVKQDSEHDTLIFKRIGSE